jgi:hypothetical protein
MALEEKGGAYRFAAVRPGTLRTPEKLTRTVRPQRLEAYGVPLFN